jgi:hypothetical protein
MTGTKNKTLTFVVFVFLSSSIHVAHSIMVHFSNGTDLALTSYYSTLGDAFSITPPLTTLPPPPFFSYTTPLYFLFIIILPTPLHLLN